MKGTFIQCPAHPPRALHTAVIMNVIMKPNRSYTPG
ncbi:hypothetical protein JOD67_006116 [Tenggerimyces flavus]|nr:hypothetical protein [Tenggerimyces flavus]